MIFDPPEGWAYGFPRVIPKDAMQNLEEWLYGCGYPESKMDLAKNHSRYILQEGETVEDFQKCHW